MTKTRRALEKMSLLAVALLLLLLSASRAFSPSQVTLLTRDGQRPAPEIMPNMGETVRSFSYGPLSRANNVQNYMADSFLSSRGYNNYYYRGDLYGTNLYPGNQYSYYYGSSPYGYNGYYGSPGYSTGYGTRLERYKPYTRGYSYYGGGPGGRYYDRYGGYGYSYDRPYYGSYGGYGGYGGYPYYGGYRDGFGYNSLWYGRDMYRYPVGGGWGGRGWYDPSGYGDSYFDYGYNGLGGTGSNPRYGGWGGYYGGGWGGYYGGGLGGYGYGGGYYPYYGGVGFGGNMLFY